KFFQWIFLRRTDGIEISETFRIVTPSERYQTITFISHIQGTLHIYQGQHSIGDYRSEQFRLGSPSRFINGKRTIYFIADAVFFRTVMVYGDLPVRFVYPERFRFGNTNIFDHVEYIVLSAKIRISEYKHGTVLLGGSILQFNL